VIARRPATRADLEFLYRLMRESLGPYVVETYGPWDEAAQCERFLRETLVETHEVVELDGEPVGCLCTSSWRDALKLHRVFLLPAAQAAGSARSWFGKSWPRGTRPGVRSDSACCA
jgi:hypothetical protein